MKKIRFLLALAIVIPMVLACFGTALASAPPDIIHSYAVNIDPQQDGTLLMTYNFDYEAVTDFADTNTKYLEVGVPNSNFEIVDYGPKDFVSGAKAITSGKSQVHLDFSKWPKKGDRFKLNFTIKQKSMAYKSGDDIGFKFVPGWFDFATISQLTVTVNLKNLTVVKIDPKPTSQSDQQAQFVTKNMDTNDKADPVVIVANKSSYPQLQDKDIVSEPNTSDSPDAGTIILIVILVIVGIVILAGIIAYFSDDGYGGGGFAGGFFGSSGSGGGLSGGGSGSFSGRGSSCACVSSCACACACAGGGRVGCSERGFPVLHWLIKHQQENVEGDKK
jgi:hypothetical protein